MQIFLNVIRQRTPPPPPEPPNAPFGFTLYIDVVDASVSVNSTKHYQTGRLIADGVEIPVTDFTLETTEQGFGIQLAATLTKPEYNQVNNASVIHFDIGQRASLLSGYTWARMIDGGFLAGKSRTINRQANTVQINVLDKLAKRWNRAPARPQIIYDPAEVTIPPITNTANLPTDETGAPVIPELIPIADLSLHKLLQRFYVAGMGFFGFETNIPDYPIDQVEVSLEGGFNQALSSLLGWARPLTTPLANNKVRIRDLGLGIAPGSTVRDLPVTNIVALAQTQAPQTQYNRIAVTYQSKSTANEDFVDRPPEFDDPVEPIPFGEPGFTSSVTSRVIRDWFRTDQPGVILRSAVRITKTVERDADSVVIREETQTDDYDNRGLKTGHLITLDGRVPTISTGVFTTQRYFTETGKQTYIPNPKNARELIPERETRIQSGLILVDPDNLDTEGNPSRTPFIEAFASRYIKIESSQTYEQGRIRKFVTEPRILSNGQVTYNRTVTNYCIKASGVPEPSTSTTLSGSTALSLSQLANQKTVYRRIAGTEDENYNAASINFGQLPFNLATDAGDRELLRLVDPPDSYQVELMAADLTIKQGDYVRPYDLDGELDNCVVVAWRITGSAGNPRLAETLTCREIRGDAPEQVTVNAPQTPFHFVIVENTFYNFTASIFCFAGFRLRSQLSSLNNISVRQFGSNGAFQNIETTPINLGQSQFVNQTIVFEFKIDAGSISGLIESDAVQIFVEPIS